MPASADHSGECVVRHDRRIPDFFATPPDRVVRSKFLPVRMRHGRGRSERRIARASVAVVLGNGSAGRRDAQGNVLDERACACHRNRSERVVDRIRRPRSLDCPDPRGGRVQVQSTQAHGVLRRQRRMGGGRAARHDREWCRDPSARDRGPRDRARSLAHRAMACVDRADERGIVRDGVHDKCRQDRAQRPRRSTRCAQRRRPTAQ